MTAHHYHQYLTWPAALVPGVEAATVVVTRPAAAVDVLVVVVSHVLAQAPLQQVSPVSHSPF